VRALGQGVLDMTIRRLASMLPAGRHRIAHRGIQACGGCGRLANCAAWACATCGGPVEPVVAEERRPEYYPAGN